MSKGAVYPSEARELRDERTGARIRQITAAPAIHHHPFFFVNAYDDAMRWLIFVSHRTGCAQLFAEEGATGNLIQLTDRNDIAEWSLSPSHDGRHVFFVAGTGAWRLDLETLKEECLADFGAVEMRDKGMVGAAMGTTALSWDDQWWAVPVKVGRVSRFMLIDTKRGGMSVILERDTIGHPQFHPNDSNLLFYAGPLVNRVWVIHRDGSGHRNPFRREHDQKWITHETWIPGRRELAFVDWPNGVRAVNVDTGDLRALTSFPAWHGISDYAGTRYVCDTNFPDIGVQLFDWPTGERRTLCYPQASNAGEHWAKPFPYNDGPRGVYIPYAPQHTHPHPRFSPDGRRVLYTSDASDHAQLFEVLLGE